MARDTGNKSAIVLRVSSPTGGTTYHTVNIVNTGNKKAG